MNREEILKDAAEARDEYLDHFNPRLDKYTVVEFGWDAAIEWYMENYGCCCPDQDHICSAPRRLNE
jgi:hypothetical protein